MGLMDKFADMFKERPDEDFDDFYDEPASGFEAPHTAPKPRKQAREVNVPREEKPERIHRFRGDTDKVVNIHTTTQVQVVLVKPEQYSESQEIADDLKAGCTVVLNLESTNRETARRILDFLSGVAYAVGGSVSRVANSTYIITPCNVNVLGDDILGELENNGMFM